MDDSLDQLVDRRIDHWKSELIDLSFRNRLLNHRRSLCIGIIKPSSQEIFETMIKGKSLAIRRLDEQRSADEGGIKEVELKKLEVLPNLAGENLDRSLVRLKLKSRMALREQGFNVLYLAFGLLRWRDKETKEEFLSPLVLLPVELRRETCFDPYKITGIDEDTVLNPTLVHKFQADFSLSLPPLPDVKGLELGSYFDEVAKSVEKADGWSIEDEVSLGLFSFTKLGMYRDLESATDLVRSHPIVRALAGDPSKLGLWRIPEHPLDDIPPQETFQILDADSSQLEAIAAAKMGASFVLQGPPGTGKSQTITNIIAESLAAGKTVLFVSEKMAALEVVKKRLDECGIGDSCLEIHSHKASKMAVLSSLSITLEMDQASTIPTHDLVRLEGLRKELNEYVRALHMPRGELALSVFEAHGELARLKEREDVLFSMPELDLNRDELNHLLNLIERVMHRRAKLDHISSSVWKDYISSDQEFGTRASINRNLLSFQGALTSLKEDFQKACAICGLEIPSTYLEGLAIIDLMERLASSPQPLRSWLSHSNIDELIDRMERSKAGHERHWEKHARTIARFEPEIMTLDTHSLYSKLMTRKSWLRRIISLEYRKDMKVLKRLSYSPHLGYSDALEAWKR